MQVFVANRTMRDERWEAFHYRDEGLLQVGLHHHDFYEIYFFLAGGVRYQVESRSYTLMPGDILLISPEELHQPFVTPETQLCERMILWVTRSFLRELGGGSGLLERCFLREGPGRRNLLRLPAAQSDLLFGWMREIVSEQERAAPDSDVLARALLARTLVELNRCYERGGHPEGADMSELPARAAELIHRDLSRPLTLDGLAQELYVSKYHLSREFKRWMGTSIHRYLIQRRLIASKQLMLDGVPLAELTRRCGFRDYSNYYRAFRAEYGMSPHEYQESLQIERGHTSP